MHATLPRLVRALDDAALAQWSVIPWSSPVPAFGDPSKAKVATLGLNPSNLEFVDRSGKELQGLSRRFHTLNSLGLMRWSDARTSHLGMILDTCRAYFSRNPYNGWFRRLDAIIEGTGHSYYDSFAHACHLDLIPYATACKWTELNRQQRASLLTAASDTLATILGESTVRLLILNGRAVVEHFQTIAGPLRKVEMASWSLPRTSTPVTGYAYKGAVRNIFGTDIGREIVVIGFNHNIQSSFGVTKDVIQSIGRWVSRTAKREAW
jgi:hypothetical protein